MKRQLIFLFTLLLVPLIVLCQTTNQPIIDMHMHAYSGELDVPNPNTGKIFAHNAEEHRSMTLMFMEKYNVVLGAISEVNSAKKIIPQTLNTWEKDVEDRFLKGLILEITIFLEN